MKLTEAVLAIALRLQEAQALSHGDLRRGLQDAVSELFPQRYAYVCDVFGTQESGDVVYSCGDDMKRAPYTSTIGEGTRKHTIDTAKAVDVLPRTAYDVETAEAKTAREARKAGTVVDITGDTIDLKEGFVGLDGTAHLKLISPGWGSSGYYSADVLKRDAPKIFKAGTQNFWNHPTETEESERPEGDLYDLASVLTSDAEYLDNGPTGPGVYAKAKVFEEFRQPLDDLAKHIGVSIRASGLSTMGEAEGKKGPIITKLTRATSADYVTRAGRGGEVLQLFEAARGSRGKLREGGVPNPQPSNTGAFEMDQAAFTALQESVRKNEAENRKLRERLAVSDAAVYADTVLGEIRYPAGVKARVKGRMLEALTLDADGNLDKPKFKEALLKELKDEAEYIESVNPSGRVLNLGTAAPAGEADAARDKRLDESHASTMGDLADFFVESEDDAPGERTKRMRATFMNGRAN